MIHNYKAKNFFFFNTCMNDEWPSKEKMVMSRIEHEYYLKDILHDYPTKIFHA